MRAPRLSMQSRQSCGCVCGSYLGVGNVGVSGASCWYRWCRWCRWCRCRCCLLLFLLPCRGSRHSSRRGWHLRRRRRRCCWFGPLLAPLSTCYCCHHIFFCDYASGPCGEGAWHGKASREDCGVTLTSAWSKHRRLTATAAGVDWTEVSHCHNPQRALQAHAFHAMHAHPWTQGR